jgi:hypothetical protein
MASESPGDNPMRRKRHDPLSDELWLYLMGFMSNDTLATVTQTNHVFSQLASNELQTKRKVWDVIRHTGWVHKASRVRNVRSTGFFWQQRQRFYNRVTHIGLGTATLSLLQQLRSFTVLQALDLTFSGVTDEGLMIVAQELTSLQSLILNRNIEFTDTGLQQLCSALTVLEYLSVASCKQLTDESLTGLRGVRRLKRLELAWCIQLTDRGLSHLAACVHLTDLDLLGVHHITDTGISYLAGLTKLQRVIVGFTTITDASTWIISRGLKYLRVLSMLELLER